MKVAEICLAGMAIHECKEELNQDDQEVLVEEVSAKHWDLLRYF